MHSWNLTNLDVEAKATLETLLKPNYLGVIPRWIVKSNNDTKKKLIKLGKQLDFKNRGILESEQMRVDESLLSKLQVRRNEPIRLNNKGHEIHSSKPHNSLDKCSTKPFDGVHLLARSYSAPGGRQPGLGGANNLHTLHGSGGDLHNYHILGNEPFSKQGVSKMLDPKISRRMEELVLGHTTDAEKAQILVSLQDLERSFKAVPPYLEFKGAQASMSRPATPSRPASRPGSRPGTPTRVGLAGSRGAQEELFEFSKVRENRFPSHMHYEISRGPPELPFEEAPPPPPEKGVRRDQQSQVYFPGNPTENQKTTYQESFVDLGVSRRPMRVQKDSRPSSAAALGRNAAEASSELQRRPSTAGGCRVGQEQEYFGTTLSPRMFGALRKRPGTVGRQG